jgi:hypothetical protein
MRLALATTFPSSVYGAGQDGGADSLPFEDLAPLEGASDAPAEGQERRGGTMKFTIEIPDEEATDIQAAVARMAIYDDRANTHGILTIESLARMLLQDVALSVRRPGSWEGSHMARVLASHGYFI